MFVVAVYAPPKLRYSRLASRIATKGDINKRFRPILESDARGRDYAEIENIEKGGPIAMADFTIINTGTIEELKQKTKEILTMIKSG
jgi:dephospho-CoA kinase